MLEQYTLKMPHAVYAGKGALANVKDITAQNAKKSQYLQIRALSVRDFWKHR